MPQDVESLKRDMMRLGADLLRACHELDEHSLDDVRRWEIRWFLDTTANDLAKLLKRMERDGE
jgi:hypothetical protein